MDNNTNLHQLRQTWGRMVYDLSFSSPWPADKLMTEEDLDHMVELASTDRATLDSEDWLRSMICIMQGLDQ